MNLTNFLIPFVYFIAGSTSLAGIATTFFYKDTLELTIPQVALLGSISIIPWSLKPIYGFVSDRFALFGLRRKPYLFLGGLLGSLGYLSLATWVSSFRGAAIATLISAIGFALSDVIVDGIVAERSRSQAEAGRLQSICRAGIMLGALLVAYLSGILVERIGVRNVFFLTGALPLITCILSVLISEIPEQITQFSLKKTFASLKAGLTPAVLWTAFFVFLWRATPSSGGAYTYFLIDEKGFQPEFFGRLAVISYGMGIVGIIVFRKWLMRIPIKTLLGWIIVASVILSLPSIGMIYGVPEYLGISPTFFAMADTLISAPLSEIAFLPLLVLATRVCPKGIEATMFALLASIMNIGLAVSDILGGTLVGFFDVHQAVGDLSANYENLHIVMWIAILSSFLPMPFLRFLPEIRATSELVPSEASPSALTPGMPSGHEEKREIL